MSLTVALSDFLDPLWGEFACLSDGLVAPGFADEAGLFHERLEPLAHKVIEAEDGIAYAHVGSVGCMEGNKLTIGRKRVLEELAVDVERAEYVRKIEEDLLLPGLGCAGGLDDVGGHASDGLCAAEGGAGVGHGLEAVVAGHDRWDVAVSTLLTLSTSPWPTAKYISTSRVPRSLASPSPLTPSTRPERAQDPDIDQPRQDRPRPQACHRRQVGRRGGSTETDLLRSVSKRPSHSQFLTPTPTQAECSRY